MYIGKIYLDKIYNKKKASLFYIYIVKHIFLQGKMSNFPIYIEYTLYSSRKERVIFPIKHTLQSGQNTKEMYRQKSVIFTIGKTLYIQAGQDIKEKKGFLLYI